MFRELGAILGMALLVAGCAGTVERAEEFAADGEWTKAVIEYRKAHAKHQRNVEYKSRLKQTELKAAEFYYHQGVSRVTVGDLDGAIAQFQQGLLAMPEHGKLQQAMADVLSRKEAQVHYAEGKLLAEAGKKAEAAAKFKQALAVYPNHKEAGSALAQLRKDQKDGEEEEGVVLKSRAPITLNFRQSDLRQAFEFLGKSFGVNVIFDETVRSTPVTLFATDVSFDQGLNLLLSVTNTFYKKVGPNTILIAPDSKEKRGQYEDHVVRTFQLNSVKAKEMADILKGLVAIKKIIVNDSLNSIVIRDTPEIVKLAGRIIENNDRKPAELVLEVEILEVNRTKAEKLGLDLGTYQISAVVPPFSVGTPFTEVRDATTLTLPSATLRFYKQDVDAKTLANPKVRVIHGKSAKIHIGDRVPLRAATIQDATGQVRTTFDYRDIGIRLTVEPDIHVDNSTTVKLGLEVSSLGENLGTVNEPAYRIGTRNAETVMLLRDGETAILGGLIRDEERNTRVRLPGLGSIPAIGSLFTSYDDSGGRTDVLLTITPRVVRGWDAPATNLWEFYSGSENVYTTKPVFAEVDGVAQVRTMSDAPAATPPGGSAPEPAPPASAPAMPASSAPQGPALAFSDAGYEVASGQEVSIGLVGTNLASVSKLNANVLFNAQVLSFVRGERGETGVETFNVQGGAAPGMVQVGVGFGSNSPPSDKTPFARLVLSGVRPGVSYLVYQTPEFKGSTGETINAQLRASRIVVK
jgi:general secretion pathway protein D